MQTPIVSHQSLDLFNESSYFVDPFRLFYAKFGEVASRTTIRDIVEEKIIKWMEDQLKHEILHKYFKNYYDPREKRLKPVEYIFLLTGERMVQIESGDAHLFYCTAQVSEASALALQFRRFVERKRFSREIRLVTTGPIGIDSIALKIDKPVLDLSRHYHEDLVLMHPEILRTLRKKSKSGLLIFHGPPGTGKSTYIRYLIHHLKKKVLFMSPGLAAGLDLPSMSRFLVQHRGSIFIIEDAEDLLVSRGKSRNAALSMLLNLTDGLLGETLGIQFIATFNTDIRHLDPALMRRGRLLVRYCFEPLPRHQARQLLDKLGMEKITVNEPMTLADIFHAGSISGEFEQRERSPIGFQAFHSTSEKSLT